MEAQDNITKQFKEAVRKSETEAFDAMDKVWKRVEARLDETEERKKVVPFRRIAAAAAVLLLLSLGVVYWVQKDPKDQVFAHQKPIEHSGTRTITRKTLPKESLPLVQNTDKSVRKSVRKNKHRQPERMIVTNGTKTGLIDKPMMQPGPSPEKDAATNSLLVAGKVLDENGEGIGGAAVKERGTYNGTLTDLDGNYELKLNSPSSKLEISALGRNSTDIDIAANYTKPTTVLSASASDPELVQIQGQAIDKRTYSGSVVTVSPPQIAKRPITEITNALNGSAKGIQVTSGGGQPGATSEMVVRGFGSVSSNNAPLVVVDGVVYKGTLTNISPADVVSMRLLKDASATAMYGSRGANGVILITTKNPKPASSSFFQKIKNIFRLKSKQKPLGSAIVPQGPEPGSMAVSRDTYESFVENPFESPAKAPLSTFSIDVDNAAYTNIRRMLNSGQTVPKDAVRIEEMVNFFKYRYPQPQDQHPFAIHTEYSTAPWNNKHQLLKIGLQGKIIPNGQLPASNLVFLIDVSGSMDEENKLPLLKSSMKLLVQSLRKEDKVAIVVYAGAAGVVLPSTSGDQKVEIIAALDQLQAGGSTAGGEGILLAYRIARENFIKNGNNRVILATDGGFNVGASSDADMKTLIEQQRKSNVFLTCMGYGMGNYRDSKMEILADKGNGNYAYIDNLQEANRFLVKEFGGTMYSIAKDVKIQVEFNPAYVAAYRLIGYENRILAAEDFVNDTIDAGELGSGHSVTALYEIIPAGVNSVYFAAMPLLKYSRPNTSTTSFADELGTIKFRYKKPDGTKSVELVHPVSHRAESLKEASADFKLAASVAWFGLKLRDSKWVPDKSTQAILDLVKQSVTNDADGYKAEFVRLVEMVR